MSEKSAEARIEAAAQDFKDTLDQIFGTRTGGGEVSREIASAKTKIDEARHWALDYARQPA